jgi:hypothetical protein
VKQNASSNGRTGEVSVSKFGLNAARGYELTHRVPINGVPAVIFPFLTRAAQMRIWLAPIVEFDARPSGLFRMTDLNGL